VSKTKAPPAAALAPPGGGVFVQASKVKKFVKAQIWGPYKSGKTHFALSFPGPTAFCDTHKGSLMYADQYDFAYREVIRWAELRPPLEYLKRERGAGFQTLIVDDTSTLYEDLINQVALAERNRWSRDIITNAGWGVIKRAWKDFITILLELPMHILLVTRAKDEYEEYTDPSTGERKTRKTGELKSDDEKATPYLLDFILHMRTVELAKKSEPAQTRYEVVVKGLRKSANCPLSKGQVIDITNKSGFDALFGGWLSDLVNGGKEIESKADVAAPFTSSEVLRGGGAPESAAAPSPAAPPPAAKAAPAMTPQERQAELNGFVAGLQGVKRLPGPAATDDDLQVLFTRAGEIRWPDNSELSGTDGKSLIKMHFGVESSAELSKPEVDAIYNELGKVLSGRKRLARREGGMVVTESNGEEDCAECKKLGEACSDKHVLPF